MTSSCHFSAAASARRAHRCGHVEHDQVVHWCAAAPPSSVAQQLADVKAMFEQGLIPSREIYEDKVRQILGLPDSP